MKIGQIYEICAAPESKIMVKVTKCRKIKSSKHHMVYEYEVRIMNSHTDEYATLRVELVFAQFCDTVKIYKLITETEEIDIQNIRHYSEPAACATTASVFITV